MDINEVNSAYELTKEMERKTNFYQSYPLNLFWADSNFQFMNEIIHGPTPVSEKLKQVINSQLYSHGQVDPIISMKQLEWWKDYFERCHGVSIMNFKLKESTFWPSEKTIPFNNSVFSIDLFRSYVYMLEIKKHCQFPTNRKTRIVELGPGCGSLCRVLTNEIPNVSYTLVDIPESLYFSYAFIRLNFPDKKCIWVNDPAFDMNQADKYDYIFIPTAFYTLLTGFTADLFVNTCSLGEMTNQVIKIWFDMIQNKMKVKYIFSVNRFLNTIHTDKRHTWRYNENSCYAHFDYKWNILKWRLEPEFASCPYYEGFASRCLELIAERDETISPANNKEKAYKYINDAKLEDWHRLFVHKDKFIMTLNDNRLFFDLEKSGTLFKLWDSMRIYLNIENISLFLQYLNDLLLKDPTKTFEEVPYYKNLLAKKEYNTI